MSNIFKVLLLSMSILFANPLLASLASQCAGADSDASQIRGLNNPPGFCSHINAIKAELNQFSPPPACVVKEELAIFSPGIPALIPCPTGSGGSSGGSYFGGGQTGGTSTPSSPPPGGLQGGVLF